MMRDLVIRSASALNRRLYRASRGKLAATMRGAPILLLTTTGRQSGKRRTMPLLYLRDGDDLIVVASKGGDPRHPSWFLNLEASPNVEVEVGPVRESRRARRATAEERERLWPRLVEMYPPYADYQQKTTREIPVVVLEHV